MTREAEVMKLWVKHLNYLARIEKEKNEGKRV